MPTHQPPTLTRQLALAAALGASFGLAELARLRIGGLGLSFERGVPVLAGYTLLALAAAAGTWLVVRAARGVGRRFAGYELPPWCERLPLAAPLLLLLGTLVNVLWLPSFLDPRSLAVDLLLLPLCVTVAASLLSLLARPRVGPAVAALWVVAFAIAAVMVLRAPRAGLGPRGRASPGSPDLVVVLVDTLRADRVGPGTDGWSPTTPSLERLAAASVRFENAFSSSNWTRPSVASLFTATMPSRHGAVSHELGVSRDLTLLPEALRAAGYRTAFFVAGGNVEPSDGYDRGIDRFYSASRRDLVELTHIGRLWVFPVVEWWRRPTGTASGQIGPETIVDEALEWFEAQPEDEPVFLYVHLQGPHSPYLPPEKWSAELGAPHPEDRLADPPEPWAGETVLEPEDRAAMLAQYDGEVLWHDAAIGALASRLESLGRSRESCFLVTADHGEAFGEHGSWGHDVSLFDEVVRVPLLVGGSGVARRGVERANVSLIDVAPTLLELAGVSAPASFDGASFAPLLDQVAPATRFAFFENPENDERGVRTDEWVYFEGAGPDGELERWLYRASDALQHHNLVTAEPVVAARLEALVAERQAADADRAGDPLGVDLDRERIERLKALGYLQ